MCTPCLASAHIKQTNTHTHQHHDHRGRQQLQGGFVQAVTRCRQAHLVKSVQPSVQEQHWTFVALVGIVYSSLSTSREM
jgi:hypothetical protein